MSKNTNNDANKLTAYERWELPHLENPRPRLDSGPSILLRKETTIILEEVDETTLVYEPLTASQLEEIRSAAYDEGYFEGLEEGYQSGLNKGQNEGFDKGFSEGSEKGSAEGMEKGFEQSIAEAKEKLNTTESILELLKSELESPLRDCKDQVEKIIYQTVARLVENITHVQLQETAERTLKAQIEHLLHELEDLEQPVRIKIHPDTADLIATFSVFERVTIKLDKDETMEPGGFLLDSKGAYIDASIESKVKSILADLNTILPRSEGSSDGA